MKDPKRVAASIEIARAARKATADAMERCAAISWDSEVLACELARLLGLALRSDDASPRQLEQALDFVRSVYAGLKQTELPSAEDAVRFFCGEDTVTSRSGGEPDGSPTVH